MTLSGHSRPLKKNHLKLTGWQKNRFVLRLEDDNSESKPAERWGFRERPVTTSPAYPNRLNVRQCRPHFVLTLLLAVIFSACGGGGGGGSTPTSPPPPPPPPPVQGAPDSGAVYVYTRDGSGVWSQQAYIKASNTDAEDVFGWSVALSGDTLAVGAQGEKSATTGIDGDQSDNSATEAGAVYVYTRDGAGVWSQQAYLKASNTDAGDNFGVLVALSGDRLVVGAFKEASAATGIDGDQSDNSANDSGAVYVYTRDGSGVWSQQAYVKASNTDAADLFAFSVALSGDTLAVGAIHEKSAATGIDGDQSDNSAIFAGAGYVYTRDGAGVWSQQAYLKASNTDADHGGVFGSSIALSGNTLVVGASNEYSAASGIDGDQGDNSAEHAGAAYVFTRDGTGIWSQQAYIKASNTDAEDFFGRSVALSGDTLAVGSWYEASATSGIDGDQSDNNAIRAGAVYVYTRDGAGVWSQQAYIKASNTDAEDLFGRLVALSGDTLVVSARGEDSAATGIDGDQGNTGFSGTVVAVHAFGSDPNAFNPNSNNVIPVAVLGSMNFDATQVNFSTTKFGPGKASPIHGGHVEDVNNDDIVDMVLHFNAQDAGIACGEFRATLSGETFGGNAFTGTYSVKNAGCR